MSAETIARWNAIPLNRPEPEPPSLKRPRQDEAEGGDDSDDDVSLVSRSPSPPPPDAMDVDKYDEYYKQRPAREVITVETKIQSTNVGFSMLAKMGWVEGSPLGLSGDGRVDPVPFYVKNDLTGLGKATQDVRMIESTVSTRRGLDSERQTKETEEQRRQREDAVARRAAVQSEISSVLRPFYCEVCEKQFQNVAQYDEHTNSYAHHHKVRFRDMQAAQRASRNTEEEVNKRKEKERKREEKELRKIAKAAGVKMTKPPGAVVAPAPAVGAARAGEPQTSGFKKSGWATVSTAANTPAAPAEPPKRSGWAAVGETQSASSGGGWATVSAPPPPSSSAPPPPAQTVHTPDGSRGNYSTAPSFRTGGWTSLETSNPVPPPPMPPQLTTAPPPPRPPAVAAPPSPPSDDHRQGWTTARPPATGGWEPVSSSGPLHGPPIPPAQLTAPPRPPPAEPARHDSSRSGWQKFRAGAPGRRR